MLHDKNVRNKKKSVKSACKSKKPVKAAESYGWVVENWDAQEAYEFACEYFGEEDLNSQIVQAIGNEELAACLAFIFRMNDFREWEQYKDGTLGEDDEEIEESVRAKGRKPVKASRKATKRSKKSVKATTVQREFSLESFEPWSGAVPTWDALYNFGKIEALEQAIDEMYYDDEKGEGVINETSLNDLLWFEPETVCEWVGLYYDANSGEISDEPFGEEIEESVKAKNKKAVKASSRKRK